MAEKKGSPSSGTIIRLNVGGEVFMTTAGTLLSAGESFFTALLSGRHENVMDSSGALFIDRSPKYFSPLLHYLRSGVLEIPPGVSRAALMREADFYGLQIATNEPPKKITPFQKDVGCYVDADDDRYAYMFTSDSDLTEVVGDYAFAQALVLQNHPQAPPGWRTSPKLESGYTQFYSEYTRCKGSYEMNADGRGLIIAFPRNPQRQYLATLSKDLTMLCVSKFYFDGVKVERDPCRCSLTNWNHFHLYKLQRF